MPEEALDIGSTLRVAMDHHENGRAAEAEALYQRIIQAAPRHFTAHNLLGLLSLQMGRLERSVEMLRKALEIDPNFARSHANLGVALRRLGKPEAAIASFDRALELGLAEPDLFNNRGAALLDVERFEAAAEGFEAAVRLKPDFATAHTNLGVALNALGRHDEALVSLATALALDPDAAAAHYNQGNAFMGLEQPAEALASFDAAIARDPGYAAAYHNRSLALEQLDRLEEAIQCAETAVALAPESALLHKGHADLLVKLGRLHSALEGFDRAVALDPTFADARWNRGVARLTLQQFEAGWADYEWRWRTPSFLTGASGQVTPELRGRLDPNITTGQLAGRRVLLVAEQGVGDVVMFASALPDLLATAGSVTLVCETRLHRLFANAFPDLGLLGPLAEGAPLPDTDAVVAIGSLGRLYRNRLADFPGVPYLSASAAVRAQWAERLGPRKGRLRIGLSWRGGIRRTGRDARSMPLAQLRPILDLPDCEFVSLQYGDVEAEVAAANAGHQRIRLPPPSEVADFEDLAGLVQTLDVVVSVQTTIIHLAGALGTPALVMVPARPEWRYGVGSPSLPWYRSVTLFRQGQDATWPPVVQRVAAELSARL
ncbi:tetratricopeptide repeat protein [uncultured Phenylobacterium sp.]|uniref:tetratricopeptide repeat protein n=1 Tax=uncultured Phenylobacterium sp. TaxID=349273 RepID=UPI0025F74366|nr:tetratricopeptide repeat protein [uncultured Phenylobacterium sp.]